MAHEQSRQWAYIEVSDENDKHLVILGGKEFPTKEEAEESSKGFALDSYVHVEPEYLKWKRLDKKRKYIAKELQDVLEELDKIDVKESWLLGGE